MGIAVSAYSPLPYGGISGCNLEVIFGYPLLIPAFTISGSLLIFAGQLTVFVIVFVILRINSIKRFIAICQERIPSTAKAFYHPLHGCMIRSKKLKNHAGDPDAAFMKVNKCENHCNPKQDSGNQPPDIAALIRRQALQKSIKNQRNHHRQNNP